MNILFLILTFLTIFACLHTKMMKDIFLFPTERRSLSDYTAGKQDIHNKWEKRKYERYKKSHCPPPPKTTLSSKIGNTETKEQTAPKNVYSHRLKQPFLSLAKWNLAPLLQSQGKNTYEKESAIRLLEELYSHTNFWKQMESSFPLLGEALIQAFCEKNTQDHPIVQLSDLFPLHPSLQFPFYKMLQGSGSYDLQKKIGYPPLKEFFCIDDSRKTLSFTYASYPALKALFGPALAEEILLLEKEKAEEKLSSYCFLTQMELTTLLSTRGAGFSLPTFETILYFSQKHLPLEELSYQGKQGVNIQVPIPR